jgi:DNA-binding HxlR family transcriptional regulator
MSSSVLNQRLAELRSAEIIDGDGAGYALSDEGRRLLDLYPPPSEWADRWARRQAAQPAEPAASRRTGS